MLTMPKAEQIAEILAKEYLSPDALVTVDNNPVQRLGNLVHTIITQEMQYADLALQCPREVRFLIMQNGEHSFKCDPREYALHVSQENIWIVNHSGLRLPEAPKEKSDAPVNSGNTVTIKNRGIRWGIGTGKTTIRHGWEMFVIRDSEVIYLIKNADTSTFFEFLSELTETVEFHNPDDNDEENFPELTEKEFLREAIVRQSEWENRRTPEGRKIPLKRLTQHIEEKFVLKMTIKEEGK